MSFWIKAEIDKYRGKQVIYNEKKYLVKEVFWNDRDEVFEYLIENESKKTHKVFEKDIQLTT